MNNIARISMVFFGIAIGVGIFSFVILNQTQKLENKVQVQINNQIIIAERVKTEKDRERGLSGRNSLGVNEGMLFDFPEPQMVTFWMKGMNFPIDIVWIRDGIVLGYVENAKEQRGVIEDELVRYNSPSSIDQVLEISAGRAKQLKLFVGSEVRIRPLAY